MSLQQPIDVRSVDRAALKDIQAVKIDTTLPRQERVKSFVEQIGNPYCYLDGDIVVSVSYASTDVSLQDRLKSFACNLG